MKTQDGKAELGLGLIEIVVSMFLIALIAIAFVPVLVSAIRSSEANSTTATAVRAVAEGVDQIRAAEPLTCGQLVTRGLVETLTDAQGETIQVTTTVPTAGDCDVAEAQLVRVEARVIGGSGDPIASARVLVAVSGD